MTISLDLRPILIVIAGILLSTNTGCGRSSAPGGTEGLLRIQGASLPDIRLTVYSLRGEATEMIGFGVTDDTGRFALHSPDATMPLHLVTGTFRFTLESIGPPTTWSTDYQDPSTTPLEIILTENRDDIELNVP